MSKRASLEDWATLKQHGFRVERIYPKAYVLLDPDGHTLMIGDHGQVSPTEYEAVAEGLKRIRADEEAEALWAARIGA